MACHAGVHPPPFTAPLRSIWSAAIASPSHCMRVPDERVPVLACTHRCVVWGQSSCTVCAECHLASAQGAQ